MQKVVGFSFGNLAFIILQLNLFSSVLYFEFFNFSKVFFHTPEKVMRVQCDYRQSCFCSSSASQSCNTCHEFMCRSQRGSTETTEPLCQGRFSPTLFTEGKQAPMHIVSSSMVWFVFAGSGPDHLPDVKEKCGNARLGQHHRAEKCSSCDEESRRGHHVDRCAGKTFIICTTSTSAVTTAVVVGGLVYGPSVLCCRWDFYMKKAWGKHTAATPAKGLSLSAPGSRPGMLPATPPGKSAANIQVEGAGRGGLCF